ncbi:MAG: AMP-binding protein [Rhizobiaceae bacterium]
MSLNEHLQHWANKTPQATAIVYGEETISFAKLAECADHAAALLTHKYSVRAGDRVTYLGLNHPNILALLLACERIGAVFNPLNSRLAPAEYAYLIGNAEPSIFIVDQQFEQLAGELPEARDIAVSLSRFFDDLPFRDAGKVSNDPETDLLLVYTSGTTGRPKGVVLSQRAVMANIDNCQHLYGFEPGQNVQITLPLFHVGGLCILLLPALTHGATIHLHQRFDPLATLQDIEQNNITTSIYVPAQMAAMMDLPQWRTCDFSSMKYAVVGSSVIPLHQIQNFHVRGVPVSQLYGATETGPAAIGLPIEAAQAKEGSAGKVVKNCQIEIRDADRNPLAIGDHGDVWVKGDNILSRYWRNEEETAKVLVDGWYNTEDIGYVDTEGFYWIVDRSKDVIISGGENIYPAEIELASLEHPAITAVAVVGQKHQRWGETPVAVVELADGTHIDLQDYQAFLSSRLAKFKHPKALLIVDQLPRNGMGKIEKSVLRQQVNQSQ